MKPVRPRSGAKILQRNIAVTGRFEGTSLGEGMALVQKAVAELEVPPSDPGRLRRERRGGAAKVISRSAGSTGAGDCAGVHHASVRVPDASQPRRRSSRHGAAVHVRRAFLALALITGTTFNISSFMGLIMVIGIVAKNGILLLDADQRFRAEGSSARDAMIEAGERRLRPILMTAMATVAGMIPLSLAIGAGSQMLQPLAIAVIGGLVGVASAVFACHASGALLFDRTGVKKLYYTPHSHAPQGLIPRTSLVSARARQHVSRDAGNALVGKQPRNPGDGSNRGKRQASSSRLVVDDLRAAFIDVSPFGRAGPYSAAMRRSSCRSRARKRHRKRVHAAFFHRMCHRFAIRFLRKSNAKRRSLDRAPLS